MSETDKDKRKSKICRLAMIAFFIPTLLLITASYMICSIPLRMDMPDPLKFIDPLIGLLVILNPFLVLTSFILGFVAIVKIALSHGLLKGYIFSILGILMSIWAFDLDMRAIHSVRIYSKQFLCQSNMKKLANATQEYSQAHNNQYPTPNEWCDLLFASWESQNRKTIEFADDDVLLGQAGFFCPAHYYRNRGKQQSSYAINPHCGPDSPADTVLLFEAVKGWNKFGGPEIMSFENHHTLSILPFRQGGKGCNVLFNDGSVKLIKPNQLDELKWK